MPDAELTKLAEARVGRVLAGKYRLDRVLGIGGMAAVYAATHRNKKRVAIKMLHPDLSGRENIRTRFLREGYVANSVDHPGAVSVLDDDVAEDGSAFLVMELLLGSSLDEVVAAEGPRLPVALVLSITDALLDVLAAAHEKGIVHRDLKPANLFLTNDARLQVLDFGIARLHDETSSEATAAGSLMGTPAFMAPEQALAESSRIDAQTDLWAVGATMFALLTGQLVHAGDNTQQLLVNAATKKARGITSVVDVVPAPIANVIDKALSFDKGERWKSAIEMRDALREACIAATGAPIPPLPKRDVPLALDRTVAVDKVTTPPIRSAEAFEPTVSAAGALAAPPEPSVTTSAPVAVAEDAVMKRGIRLAVMAAVLLVVVVVLIAGSIYRAAVGPKVHYCLGLDERRDGPHCAFEISRESLAKRRTVVARVTTRRGLTELVEHVNFAGIPTARDSDFARMEIKRDDSGAVTDVIKSDQFGVITQWQKRSENGARIDYVDIDGKTPRRLEGTRITTTRLEFDGEGRVKRRFHFGPTGKPRADDQGAYGEALEWGKTPGIFTKITYLDPKGEPAATTNGVGAYHRPDNGLFWGDFVVHDIHDQPTTRKGVHIDRVLHDDIEDTGQAFFGLNGEPITNLDQSFHEFRISWDAAKHTAEYVVYDEHGRPQPARDLWFWAMRRHYDDRGRLALEETLDGQGNLLLNISGWSAFSTKYDAEDHIIGYEQLGPSRALVQTIHGFARREIKHDAHDNRLEIRYFDEAGHPTLWKEGAAIERETFDERDLHLTRDSFDADEHPIANAHGFATERVKYDHLRNRVEVALFDVEGKPTMSTDGFAIKRWTYDENDDLVAESYFDATGAPTPFQSSFATRKLKNDERGLVIEESYLDVHGDPTLVKAGYATVKRVRDRSGDVIEESYFGKHGEPVLREGGFSKRTTSFDIARRPIEVSLFGVAGEPVRGTAGWSIERNTYDARGLVVRVDHLDAAKAPALDRDERASIARVFDSRGNMIEETSLDVIGKPVASKKTNYDDRDAVIEEAFFGADGAPVDGKAGWALRRVRYDDFGKMIEEAFFDRGHEPVAPKELAYSSLRQRFDAKHHLIEIAYFDVRGVATAGPEGAPVVRYVRDGFGRATETAYIDGLGAPMASKEGRWIVRTTYDAIGHATDEHFVDASSAPRADNENCAGHHTKYDALGRKLEESCLDASGAKTFSTSGWALRRTLHDARGNDVEITTYAPDGTLHGDKDGIARRRSRFDDRNVRVETTFFDVAGKKISEPLHRDKR